MIVMSASVIMLTSISRLAITKICNCERNWSAFDFIHSKKRNKLSPAKAEELVYVFSNLRAA